MEIGKGDGAWRLALSAPAPDRGRFAAALEPFASSIAIGEPDQQGRSFIEAIAVSEPDRGMVRASLALLSASLGVEEPAIAIERLAPTDWLMVSRQAFAPIRLGRFFIHGSEFHGRTPAGCIGLSIDAGMAFGTGRHESTQGCLSALQRLARSRRVARALDLGCGCGILGIAAARLWTCRVVAADIDDEAVRVARITVRRNGLAARIETAWSDGPRRRRIAATAPFDLIAANLVPSPLLKLARDLSRVLAPGGILVAGGMLIGEAAAVERRYRALGLHLLARTDIGSWRTLIFERPRGRTSRLVPFDPRP